MYAFYFWEREWMGGMEQNEGERESRFAFTGSPRIHHK